MSGRFEHAEGWRRHLHWGFCGADDDPLRAALGAPLSRQRPIRRVAERCPVELSAIAPGLVGLHDARPRADRRSGAADAARSAAAVAARLHASCSTTRSRTSTSPRRSSTSTRGGRARDDTPVGICGPIGPTEQLPLVARLVNALDLDVRSGHFWGMDEWFDAATGKRSAGHASTELRARRSRAVLQSHPPRAADARCAPALPQGRHRAPTGAAGTPACAAR